MPNKFRTRVVDAMIATANMYVERGISTETAADLPLVKAIVELYEHILDTDERFKLYKIACVREMRGNRSKYPHINEVVSGMGPLGLAMLSMGMAGVMVSHFRENHLPWVACLEIESIARQGAEIAEREYLEAVDIKGMH